MVPPLDAPPRSPTASSESSSESASLSIVGARPASRKGRRVAFMALAVAGGAILGYVGLSRGRRPAEPLSAESASAAPVATAAPSSTPSAPVNLPVESSSPLSEAVAPTPSAAAPPKSTSAFGDLVAPKETGGHRVYVDGHVVGQSPGTFHVRCGRHAVRIGSGAATKTVNVPCGGFADLSL